MERIEPPATVQASFYGGPADGLTIQVRMPPAENVEFPVILPGGRLNEWGEERPNIGTISYRLESWAPGERPVYTWF